MSRTKSHGAYGHFERVKCTALPPPTRRESRFTNESHRVNNTYFRRWPVLDTLFKYLVPLKKAFRIKTSQLAWHCPAGRPDVEAWRRSRFDMSRRIDNTNFRCCLCVPSDLCSRTIYDNSKAVVSRCDADPRATSLLKKMLNKRLGLCRTGRANSRNTSTRATSTKQKATCEGKHSMFCVMKYW